MITSTFKNKTMTLVPFKRSRGAGKDAPFVSLSKTGFNFSKGFCTKFEINTTLDQYIIFHADGEGQFGFWISNDEETLKSYLDCPALKLQTGAGRSGFGINAKEFRAKHTAKIEKDYLNPDNPSQHFYPELAPCSNGFRKMPESIKLFLFEAGKNFERSITPQQLESDTSYSHTNSLYRYLDIDDVVIYIGIGKLRDRFMSDARTADWGIHTIEYSIVEDESDRKNLEAKATKMYEDKYGCLPKYNRKHGG